MTFSSDERLYEDFNTPEKTVFDEEAIKNSIRNILLTPIGTMPGKPDFGSRLLEDPFNQNDVSNKSSLRGISKMGKKSKLLRTKNKSKRKHYRY